jgi:hypothetical protein
MQTAEGGKQMIKKIVILFLSVSTSSVISAGFFDKEIKNYFLKNYKFENRLIVVEKKEIKDDIYSWFSKDENFDENSKYQLKGSVRKILSDIEVYVRKN